MNAQLPLNESVISEEVKALASELWLNSMGLPTRKESWSMPLVSENTIARKVQALLNASNALLREQNAEMKQALGKLDKEIRDMANGLLRRSPIICPGSDSLHWEGISPAELNPTEEDIRLANQWLSLLKGTSEKYV